MSLNIKYQYVHHQNLLQIYIQTQHLSVSVVWSSHERTVSKYGFHLVSTHTCANANKQLNWALNWKKNPLATKIPQTHLSKCIFWISNHHGPLVYLDKLGLLQDCPRRSAETSDTSITVSSQLCHKIAVNLQNICMYIYFRNITLAPCGGQNQIQESKYRAFVRFLKYVIQMLRCTNTHTIFLSGQTTTDRVTLENTVDLCSPILGQVGSLTAKFCNSSIPTLLQGDFSNTVHRYWYILTTKVNSETVDPPLNLFLADHTVDGDDNDVTGTGGGRRNLYSINCLCFTAFSDWLLAV